MSPAKVDGRSRRRDRTGGPVADDTLELIRGFSREQQRRGLMASTVDQRRRQILLMAEYMYPRSVLELDRDSIEAFLDLRSLVPRSRYLWISNFHTFFDWALMEGLVDTDPTLRIRRPRAPRVAPRPIRSDDLAVALAGAPEVMKAWLTLGAFQGLRCQEIAGLQREDIFEAQEPPVMLVTHGKGGHERVLPLNPLTMPALRVAGLPRAGYVFTQRDTKSPFPPWRVSQLINQYLKSIAVDATAHSLRHWFGTNVYARCRDLRVTQELLGHASPTTTTIYVAFSAADSATAVQGLSL